MKYLAMVLALSAGIAVACGTDDKSSSAAAPETTVKKTTPEGDEPANPDTNVSDNTDNGEEATVKYPNVVLVNFHHDS